MFFIETGPVGLVLGCRHTVMFPTCNVFVPFSFFLIFNKAEATGPREMSEENLTLTCMSDRAAFWKKLWTPTAATLLEDWKRKMSSTPEVWPFLWETTSNWRITPSSLKSFICCGSFKERDPSAFLFLSLRSEGWFEYMYYACRQINDCFLFRFLMPPISRRKIHWFQWRFLQMLIMKI